ncbi:MAG: 2-amino-4-hydroxy-6-hydroxymethyldihydropteridine diphosphokinase [Fimbriimonadaceae bacterium]|nr:2-amino-4-hydroxy-6-hydroxymethyldihydropteridine diphosphokinase [Fimbriimonadaceae bacterium]
MTPILVALGSNVGDRAEHVRSAIEILGSPLLRLSDFDNDQLSRRRRGVGGEVEEATIHLEILSISPLYRTAPMYVTDQPEFLNGALFAETTLSPRALLKLLKDTEAEVGRLTRQQNGPREIDLDLIAYGSAAYQFGDDHHTLLQIPHPKTAERRFVLQPLNDIAPDFLLPGIGVVRELLAQTESKAETVMPYEDAAISL